MFVHCKRCNRKYHIPDYRLDNRRVYFFCENCNHRIVVDRKKDRFARYRALASGTLSLKDLLEGIYLSFNMKNVGIMLGALLLFLFSGAGITWLASMNLEFVRTYPEIAGAGAGILLLLSVFLWNVLIYLLSRNVFHRIRTGANLRLGDVDDEINNDLWTIFLLSAGIFVIFALLVVPLFFLGEYSLIQGGLLLPVYAFLAVCLMILMFANNIVMAFVAARSRGTGYTLKSLLRFFAVENINIFCYVPVVWLVTFFVAVPVAAITGCILGGLLLALSAVSGLGGAALGMLGGVFTGLQSLGHAAGGGEAIMSLPVQIGLVLVGVTALLTILFVQAYLINLYTTLSTVAVFIMEAHPGNSVSRKVLISLIIFSALFTVVLVLLAAVFQSGALLQR